MCANRIIYSEWIYLKTPGGRFLSALDPLCSQMKSTHSLYVFRYTLGSTVAGQLPALHAVRICLPNNNPELSLAMFHCSIRAALSASWPAHMASFSLLLPHALSLPPAVLLPRRLLPSFSHLFPLLGPPISLLPAISCRNLYSPTRINLEAGSQRLHADSQVLGPHLALQ